MAKMIHGVRSERCLKLVLGLFFLCSLSEMIATEWVRRLSIPRHPGLLGEKKLRIRTEEPLGQKEKKENQDIVKESLVYIEIQKIYQDVQEKMKKEAEQKRQQFDSSNNDIALLRELSARDLSGTEKSLENEIKNLSLEKLVDLRNFTAQQDFSHLGDASYVRIDELMDERLLREAKIFLGRLMAQKNHFFNRNDYNQFARLNDVVGEKVLKDIWQDQDIQKELLRVAKLKPTSLNAYTNMYYNKFIPLDDVHDEQTKRQDFATQFITTLVQDKKLAPFLEGVKKMYMGSFHIVHDEQSRAIIQEMKKRKKRQKKEGRKWFWQRWIENVGNI